MKKWILILLCATNQVVFCQEDSSMAKNNKTHGIRISFGLGASPIWNYMKDKKDDFNLSTGFLTSVNFDNFLELRTGLLVDVKKYSVYEYIIYHYYPVEVIGNEKNYKFQYFRIPANFNFYFLRKMSLLMYSSIGFVFGIPVYNDSGSVNFHPIDYSAQRNSSGYLGAGVKYYFHENFNIGIEPFIGYFLNPIVQVYHTYSGRNNPTPNHTRFIESVNSRNYFGAIISINYNFFIPSVKK